MSFGYCQAQNQKSQGQLNRQQSENAELMPVLPNEISPEELERLRDIPLSFKLDDPGSRFRSWRVGQAVQDLFFDEMLQIVIDSPEHFDSWELTENQTNQIQKQLDTYREYRKQYVDTIEKLDDEVLIRHEANQLAKRRQVISQTIKRMLLPDQVLSLVPINSKRYGLTAHATNERILGKWLKLTSRQEEKIRKESKELCQELELALADYRQKSADIFFKNLEKQQREKFFSVFLPEKVKLIYGRVTFDDIYDWHFMGDPKFYLTRNSIQIPASKVVIGNPQGRLEQLEDGDFQKSLRMFSPAGSLANLSNEGTYSERNKTDLRQQRLATAFSESSLWEFALIYQELKLSENPNAFDQEFLTQLKEIVARRNRHYKLLMEATQVEGTDKWATEMAKLGNEEDEFVKAAKSLFSDRQLIEMLPPKFGINDFFSLAHWAPFQNWLEITEHQLKQMRDESGRLATQLEEDLFELRQKSANILLDNLTRAQQDQFFNIFERKKLALFWGELSFWEAYTHLHNVHSQYKGEMPLINIQDGDPLPPPYLYPLQRFTEIKLPK